METTRTEYYPSKAVKSVVTLRDGLPQGLGIEYYESGAVKKKVEYVQGRPEGIAHEFYTTGELWTEEVYREGKLHGTVRSFFRNGKLLSTLNYSQGKLHGLCRVYYPDGTLKKEGRFQNGEQTGKARLYDKTGSLHEKGDFFAEIEQDSNTVYEAGRKVERVSGKNLLLQFGALIIILGIFAYMFGGQDAPFGSSQRAQVKKELRKAGQGDVNPLLPPKHIKDGIIKTYYETGELFAEWSYRSGVQDGLTRKYHRNGKIQAEINYKNGLLDGPSIIYHDNGRVVSKTLYREGEIVMDKEDEGWSQMDIYKKRMVVPQPDFNELYAKEGSAEESTESP